MKTDNLEDVLKAVHLKNKIKKYSKRTKVKRKNKQKNKDDIEEYYQYYLSICKNKTNNNQNKKPVLSSIFDLDGSGNFDIVEEPKKLDISEKANIYSDLAATTDISVRKYLLNKLGIIDMEELNNSSEESSNNQGYTQSPTKSIPITTSTKQNLVKTKTVKESTTMTETSNILKTLSIHEATAKKDPRLFVVNTAHKARKKKGNIIINALSNGQPIVITIKDTWIPQDLSLYGNKNDIIGSPDFMKICRTRMVSILEDECAARILMSEDARAEDDLINTAVDRSLEVAQEIKEEITVKNGIVTSVIERDDLNDDQRYAILLRERESICKEDWQYIAKHLNTNKKVMDLYKLMNP